MYIFYCVGKEILACLPTFWRINKLTTFDAHSSFRWLLNNAICHNSVAINILCMLRHFVQSTCSTDTDIISKEACRRCGICTNSDIDSR